MHFFLLYSCTYKMRFEVNARIHKNLFWHQEFQWQGLSIYDLGSSSTTITLGLTRYRKILPLTF